MPASLLKDFNGWWLYGLQPCLCKKWYNTYRLLGACSSKIYRCIKRSKLKIGKAQLAINYIVKLYRIEKRWTELSNEERSHIRNKESSIVLHELKAWLDKSILQSPKASALGKALYYLNNNCSRLVEFLTDGIIPLDYNAAENAIRPFVVGRKN